MKKFIFLFAIFGILVSCQNNTDKKITDNQVVKADSSKLATYLVQVKGMSCTGCENTIKTAVSELPGVTGVAASFSDGIAKVCYDTTLVNGQQIAKAITDKGYEVTGFQRMNK
jgi:copper chaperone CopZ